MSRVRSLVVLISLTALGLLAGAATAADFQPLEDIRAAAIGAALPEGQDSTNSVAEIKLDPELRLPRCSEPLQANISTRGVAEVNCPGALGWRLYVPLRVTRTQQVLVVSRPLAAGQTVTADALTTETRNTAVLAGGLIYNLDQAVGRIAVRALVAGKPLLLEDLAAPRVVHRGEAVMLILRGEGIEVRAPGKALSDGGIAERVNVENVSSHRVVQGIVRSAGVVDVAL
jgi:flagella basal body P-ring formation protein FlgA